MKRLLIIIVVGLLTVWFLKPELIIKTAETLKSFFKKEAKQQSESVIVSAVNSVDEYIRQSSQAVLGEQIGLPLVQKPEAEIVENVPEEDLDNIILIDYLTAKDLKLELKLNKPYYLDLRNVPEGYCLYVNQTSYSVDKNEFLSLNFESRGTYNLTFDKCDKGLQKFGEIVVE
jgi:hypothetical protein